MSDATAPDGENLTGPADSAPGPAPGTSPTPQILPATAPDAALRDRLRDAFNADPHFTTGETVSTVMRVLAEQHGDLRDQIANTIRAKVRISAGPRALADLNAGRSIAISGGEADDAALAVMPVVAARLAAATQRAEQAERERGEAQLLVRQMDASLTLARQLLDDAHRRAERAEAAVQRVQAVTDAMQGTPGTRAWGDRLHAAITGTAPRPGLRVHELRNAQGRSLAELADAAGLTRETIRNIETGDTTPLPESLDALAIALDVPRGALDLPEGT